MPGKAVLTFALGAMLSAALALPAIASADEYCVNVTGCPADHTFTADMLQPALAAASADVASDTVTIGPGTYTGQFQHSGDDDEIVGAGTGETILTYSAQPAANQRVLQVGAGTTLTGLSIVIPDDGDGVSDVGLSLNSGASASHVDIDGTSDEAATGVQIGNGAFQQGSIVMKHPAADTAAIVASGTAQITGVRLVADAGVRTASGTTTVVRANIRAALGLTTDASTINASNSLIDLGADGSAGVRYANFNASSSTFAGSLNGLTIVGGDPSGSTGVYVQADELAETAAVTIANTVISGPQAPIRVLADDGRTATVGATNSNWDEGADEINDDVDGDGTTGFVGYNGTGISNDPPGFVDAAGGDFHLAPGSTLIDAGDASGAGELDLDGGPRALAAATCPIDPGTRDVGAYEFVRDCIPPKTTIDSGPSGLTRESRPRFTYSSEPGATFECAIDGQPLTPCASGGFEPASALGNGAHTFSVRATDATANVESTPASRSFDVDATGPEISIAGKAKIKLKKRKKRGKAVFTLTANEPVTGFTCALDKAPAAPCSASFTARSLKAGRHTLVVTATDAAGNQSTAIPKAFVVKKGHARVTGPKK